MPTTDLVPDTLNNPDAARALVEWESMPKDERQMTMTELADKYDMSRERLYQWRQEAWFQNSVRRKVLAELASHRASVYAALRKEAIEEQNIAAIRHYSEILGDKVTQIDVTSNGESITEDKARSMTTEELTQALLKDKAESKALQRKLEGLDVDMEELAPILMELLDS